FWYLNGCARRIFVVCATFQLAAIHRFPGTAPLLKEERNSGRTALLANRKHPLLLDRPSTGAAFSANDYPTDAFKINSSQVFEQGFNRKKTHSSSRIAQMLDSRQTVLAVLYAYAPPNVLLRGCKSQPPV